MRYGDHFDHMDGGGWVFAAVMLMLLVALAVAAIFWLSRARRMETASQVVAGGGGGSARELLDLRLVAGEIGEDEYRRLRATLAETPAPSAPGDPPPKPL